MEHNGCLEHTNHMVFGITCLFCVFYVCRLCIHGGKRVWALFSFWFGSWMCELIYVGFCSSWKLVGVWLLLCALDYGKTRSCKYLKEGSFTIGGIGWLVFGRTKKKTKYFEVCLVFSEANKMRYVKMHWKMNVLHAWLCNLNFCCVGDCCNDLHISYNVQLLLPPSWSLSLLLIFPSFKCLGAFWVQNLLKTQKDV